MLSARAKVMPTWRLGDRVHWKGRIGTFRRDVGDGEHVEIVIEQRIYRVRIWGAAVTEGGGA
jgi:hypothetical protein